MRREWTRYDFISLAFWILALATVVIWPLVPDHISAWDVRIYQNAIFSLRAGHDPYVDGIAVQRLFHSQLALHPNVTTPFTYVYSPITLPALRLIGALPFWLSGGLYWLLYVCCSFLTVWAMMQAAEVRERNVFVLLAPAAVFFPGLLQNDTFYSGNVAYILYGFAFAAAALGWRSGRWLWFYIAVLLASCCKAPLLSLLAIPVLSARKQWMPTCITGAAGIILFAAQPLLWPDAFHRYLEAVELQFSFNHDFSTSAAGLLADALYDKVPYQRTSAIFYGFFAMLVVGVLFYVAKLYFAGRLSLRQWIPVMLVGTVLLNPRIMEYDVAPMSLPLAFIAWRTFGRITGTYWRTVAAMCIFFAAINILAIFGWKQTECLLMICSFAAGSWNLITEARQPSGPAPDPERPQLIGDVQII